MLKQIALRNFKCFKEETPFPFAEINLLTGVNGKGKSSLLQSLLLMRQSLGHDEKLRSLILNGDCVQLGMINDIKNSNNPIEAETFFQFTAQGIGCEVKLECQIHTNADDALVGDIKTVSKGELGRFPIDFRKIHYVSADRLGPQKFYEKRTMDRFVHVGPRGEYVANVLHLRGEAPVHKKLYLGKDAQTLEQQTEEWLKEIFGEAKITLMGKESESSILTLLLNNTTSEKKWYKPANVGFGYSYILPIIISGLIAAPGEILIVENPEAHLHPRAQSKLTHFLARVASCGVQVFIESHSEHIFNTLRICVKNKDYSLTHQNVSVLYFMESGDLPVVQIPINPDGSVDDWQEDFFDQAEKDLREIIGF